MSNTLNPLENVFIYADGAASPNPGRGGYGVVLLRDGRRQEISGGFRLTTNNRMEILGAIVGLRALKSFHGECGEQGAKPKATLYSDSKYVVDMFNGGYAAKWRENGWTRNRGKDKALNPDLWGDLLSLAEQHDVTMVWVRGHADNVENSRCDELAVAARQGDDLPADEGYEAPAVPVPPTVRQGMLFDWM